MDVEISQGGYVYHDRYAQGHPVVELEDGLLPKIGKTKKTGTKINFLMRIGESRKQSTLSFMSRMESLGSSKI